MWSCNSQRHQKYLKMFIFQKVTKTQIKSLLILLIVFLLLLTSTLYHGRNPRRCDAKQQKKMERKGKMFSVLLYSITDFVSISHVWRLTTTKDWLHTHITLFYWSWSEFLLPDALVILFFYCFEVRGGFANLAPSLWFVRRKWMGLSSCYYGKWE